MHEICICAAVRLKDGRIIRGHRHGDCIRTAMELVEWEKPGSWMGDHRGDSEQGFVTSTNRFVGRDEGLALQVAAGIESADGEYRCTLFSEDLY